MRKRGRSDITILGVTIRTPANPVSNLRATAITVPPKASGSKPSYSEGPNSKGCHWHNSNLRPPGSPKSNGIFYFIFENMSLSILENSVKKTASAFDFVL